MAPTFCSSAVRRLKTKYLHLSGMQKRWCIFAFKKARAASRTSDFYSEYYQVAESLVASLLLEPNLKNRALNLAGVALGLKLAQEYSLATVCKKARSVSDARVKRALMAEAFYLVRKSLRERIGSRAPVPDPMLWVSGKQSKGAWTLICDGSVRANGASIGIVILNADHELKASVSTRITDRGSAVYAELRAVQEGLEIAKLLAVSEISVVTDCLAVFRAFEQKLTSKYEREIHQLKTLALDFESLQVRLAPRTETRLADSLASKVFEEPTV